MSNSLLSFGGFLPPGGMSNSLLSSFGPPRSSAAAPPSGSGFFEGEPAPGPTISFCCAAAFIAALVFGPKSPSALILKPLAISAFCIAIVLS